MIQDVFDALRYAISSQRGLRSEYIVLSYIVGGLMIKLVAESFRFEEI